MIDANSSDSAVTPAAAAAPVAVPTSVAVPTPVAVPTVAYLHTAAVPATASGSVAPAELDLLTTVHTALRGRYPLVIFLGLLGAVAGALVGWSVGTPQYSSEAVVGVEAGAPMMGEDAPDSERGAEQLRDFVQLQERLVLSRQALALAMKDPQWLAANKARGSIIPDYATPVGFADHIKIDSHTGMRNTLKISFTDPSPVVAAAGTSAVVRAYSAVYAQQEDAYQQHKAAILEAHRQALSRELQTLEDNIRQLDGDLIGDPSLDEVARLRAMLTLSPAGSSSAAVDADPVLRNYVQSRDQVQQQLQSLKDDGFGDNHPEVAHTKAALAEANDRLARYARGPSVEAGGLSPSPAPSTTATATAIATAGVDPTAKQRYDDARLQAIDAAGKTLTRDRLRDQDDQLSSQLAKLSSDIEALPLQAQLRGRVLVVVDNEVPMHPLQDRRLLKAGAAGCFGLMLPAATLVGLGTVRRRFRFAEETADSIGGGAGVIDPGSGLAGRVTLLGAIPNLRPRDVDGPGGVSAAHAVNQLRVMLQMGRRRGQTAGSIYAVASAGSGEGKTSVTAALGLAFAASGSRTLMIDFDLVGRVLTDSLDAASDPGVCDAVADGLVGHAAARPPDDHELLSLIRPTPQPGLELLPAGEEGLLHAGMLTQEAAADLLAAVRDRYDVVLLDTGPVLGSVDAAVVTPEADAVVLVIARGQQQLLVEQAVNHLRAIGARLAGLVFNRADRTQFRHSSQPISQRVHRPPGRPPVMGRPELADQLLRLGTLVRAVATFLPTRAPRRALVAMTTAVPPPGKPQEESA